MSVDLPAFGKPTRPTSASSLSSSRRSFSSPGSPGCTLRGARFVDVAKCAFPMPPRPPRDEHALTFGGKIREHFVGFFRVAGLLVDQRADRHGQLEILAALAGAVRSLTVVAASGRQLGMEPVVDERIGMRAGDDEDRT